jgi:uncharacterized membrane protein
MQFQTLPSHAGLLAAAVFGILLFSLASVSPAAEPTVNQNAVPVVFQWQALEIPKALVAVGVWGDNFQWSEALHQQGIEYQSAYRAQNAYHRPQVQMVDMPTELADYQRFSTVVLINVDAPALGPARLEAIRQFVERGGGLVVLGGYWAFERGAYAGTPLEEMLPVKLPPRGEFHHARTGTLLAADAFSDWHWKVNFDAAPRAFYYHPLIAKPRANTILHAGDSPVMFTGSFGVGRVVACGLTVNGKPSGAGLAFWDWEDWPALLGQAIEWAGANRPLHARQTVAAKTVSIDADEAEKLRLGFQKLSPEVLARFIASPTAPAADAIFSLLFPENQQQIEFSPALVAALAERVQPEWSEALVQAADSLNPNLPQRRVALELLGATQVPVAAKSLLVALDDTDISTAAIAGLRRLQDAAQRPALERLYEKSLASADFRNFGEGTLGNTSASVQGRIAVACAIALYHLGDASGVQRLVELHREIRLLRRIYNNAAKRRVVETDPTGIAIRAAIYKQAADFSALEQQLLQAAGPVPESQRAAFAALAKNATQAEDVLWLAAAMHRTPGSVDWSALAQAKDGIIRRLASPKAMK